MKRVIALLLALFLIVSVFAGCQNKKPAEEVPEEPQKQEEQKEEPKQEEPEPAEESVDGYLVGVGTVDITPEEEVSLVGNTTASKSAGVDTPLFVKAAVIAAGEEKLILVTIDTLKFPDPDEIIRRIATETGVPQDNIMITASHTHSAPYYTYYFDNFAGAVSEAVAEAMEDLEPVTLGMATAETSGLTQNRRWLDSEGNAWNAWLLTDSVRKTATNPGPEDSDVELLAAVQADGNVKAVLWNFACHACTNTEPTISADYPGHVQQNVNELLGYETATFFLTGACGDINAIVPMETLGQTLAEKIVGALDDLTEIEAVSVKAKQERIEVASRDDEFKEDEVAQRWPSELEHYRTGYEDMKKILKPTYTVRLSAMDIGGQFAIAANPGELFSQYGLNIKSLSPYAHTMVVEATNGFVGYIPTQEDFDEGGYETWLAEHSYLARETGDIFQATILGLISELSGVEIESDMVSGMEIEIVKVVDAANVIVKFNKEVWGCTDAPNYRVTDNKGNVYTVVSANSAFAELGGEMPNVFRLTFSKNLPVGKYTVVANNMIDSISEPIHTYMPAKATFEITADTQGAEERLGTVKMTIHKVVDTSNVIVRFSSPIIGCTDAPNYTVTSSSGAVQTIVSAKSAFAELGGEVPDVFKLTFASPLAKGTYTVTASNMTDASGDVGKMSATFTIDGGTAQGGDVKPTDVKLSIQKVVNSSNVIVRFSHPVDGCTEVENYVVKNSKGVAQAIRSAKSAFVELGGEFPDVFKLTFVNPLAAGTYTVTANNVSDAGGTYSGLTATFTVTEDSGDNPPVGPTLSLSTQKVVDSANVIIHFSEPVNGCTETENYVVTNASGEVQTVTKVASAFVELGGSVPDVFKLTFAEPLAIGTYTVTASNMADVGGTYDPVSTTFEITSSTPGGETPSETTLSIQTFRVVDKKNVIIQLDKDVNGATEIENYTVKNSSGVEQTITVASSAFMEIGGTTPNVFKLTFAEELAIGTYTVTAKNMMDGALACPDATTTFEITSSTPSGGETPETVELTASVYSVVDTKNVILQLSKDVMGATDVPNYAVENASGEAQTVSVVGSAFVEIGGAAPNVFKLTFADELPVGTYTVTVSGMTFGGVACTDATVDFEITEATPGGEPTPETVELTASVYSVVDTKNVILQLSKAVMGATETVNYTVTDASGANKTVSSVTSAFNEIGGAAPNVFKLTFANVLPAGTYTVTVSGMTFGGVPCTDATVTFEIEAPESPTISMSVKTVVDKKNVIVKFDKEANGCTENEYFTVKNASGIEQTIQKIASAFDGSGESVNTFTITFVSELADGTYTVSAAGLTEIGTGKNYNEAEASFQIGESLLNGLTVTAYKLVDSSNVIVQLNKDVNGANEIANYVVKDSEGTEQTISAAESAFLELGGEAANVFKLTFAAPLADGDYTVTAKNMTDSSGKYAAAETTFTVSTVSLSAKKVIDNKNVIVQFGKEVDGCTTAANYTVKNSSGETVAVSAAESAFFELNKTAGNVFHLSFASELAPGTYTVTANNMTASGVTCLPAAATFTVKEQSGAIEMEVYRLVDQKTIIVKFGSEVNGCTDVDNYVVRSSSGAIQTVASAESAFMELNQTAGNVFKLTLENDLEDGDYTVEARCLTSGDTAYAPVKDEFRTLSASVYQIMDNKNVVFQFSKEVGNCTEKGFYSVSNADHQEQTISTVGSAFAELGCEAPNVFKVTFENELAAGKYYVDIKNMFTEGYGVYKTLFVTFTVE